jgi:hypothetical protein
MIPPSVNDRDLSALVDRNTWSDTTFSILNFECSVMHRVVWLARPKFENKEVDIPTVLGWVMDFRMQCYPDIASLRRTYQFNDTQN